MVASYWILFLGFLIVQKTYCFSDDIMEMAKILHETCSKETNVDEAFIISANQGDLQPDPQFKCYIHCLMQHTGSYKDDGTFDTEAMIDMTPDEFKGMVEPIITTCGTQHGEDACDTAFLTHKCYQTTNPDLYFII